MLVSRAVVLVPGGAALNARPPLGWVNITAAHARQIDHHAAVGNALPGNVMAAPSSGDLETLSPGEAHCVGEIGGVAHLAMSAGRLSTRPL